MTTEGMDTMTDTQLTAWVAEQQRLSALLTAQREQKAKYPGNPGNPLSIRREQRHKKKELCQQAAFKCVHRWRLEECNGSPVLVQRGAGAYAEDAAVKRHAYRYFGITWSWRPLGPSFGAAPCEMCRLSFTAKVHRRLR